jgi:hypothetical protein
MIDDPAMRYTELLETPADTGIYVSVKFDPESVDRLAKFAAEHEIPNPISPDDYHATVVYSRKPIFWRAMHEIGHLATPKEWTVFAPRDLKNGSYCLVLLLDSKFLQTRFDLAISRGGSYDFPEYKPHISFSYDVPADFDASVLPVPNFDVVIDKEIAERLND